VRKIETKNWGGIKRGKEGGKQGEKLIQKHSRKDFGKNPEGLETNLDHFCRLDFRNGIEKTCGKKMRTCTNSQKGEHGYL